MADGDKGLMCPPPPEDKNHQNKPIIMSSKKTSELRRLLFPSVSYSPVLADLFGSIEAAVLWQHILKWSESGWREDGFIYKTKDEIYNETRLTRKLQDKARKVLEGAGYLETRLLKAKGVPTLHYRVNEGAVHAALGLKIDHSGSPQRGEREKSTKNDKNGAKIVEKFLSPQRGYPVSPSGANPSIYTDYNYNLPAKKNFGGERMTNSDEIEPDVEYEPDESTLTARDIRRMNARRAGAVPQEKIDACVEAFMQAMHDLGADEPERPPRAKANAALSRFLRKHSVDEYKELLDVLFYDRNSPYWKGKMIPTLTATTGEWAINFWQMNR